MEDINNRLPKRTCDENNLLNTLLTPNNDTTKYGTENLTHAESDESDNDEDNASVEDEEQFRPKVILTTRKSCVNSALEPGNFIHLRLQIKMKGTSNI